MATPICRENHILIGLGGTGGRILKAFKMRMFEEFPDSKERDKNSVSLLYIDTIEEMMSRDGRPRPDFRVMGQDASFTKEEFLCIKEPGISYMLDHIDDFPAVKAMVPDVNAAKEAIGDVRIATGQKRFAGRLLFAANASAYVNSLKNAFIRCSSRSGNQGHLFIHIFAGLSGGTGSGCIIDAIVQARKCFPDAIILVYAMIPELNIPNPNMDQGFYYQNGYAALCELNALQVGRYIPLDVTSASKVEDCNGHMRPEVANIVTLYSNVNEYGVAFNVFELSNTVSDYAFARIFLLDEANKESVPILRAYSFESMCVYEYEYDELSDSNLPAIARTKTLHSFGSKRVIYPELRLLKHITFTIGKGILLQFKYNNWREERGYIDEKAYKDYDELYINKTRLEKWMLDLSYLTLDKKILSTDKDYQSISNYWQNLALDYANDKSVKSSKNPLDKLDIILKEHYENRFRDFGVESYYHIQAGLICELALEIRSNIEKDLFEIWKLGNVSIIELQRISEMLLVVVGDLVNKIEKEIRKTEKEVQIISEDCKANVEEWCNMTILQRIFGRSDRIIDRHQNDLAELYAMRTRTIALQLLALPLAKRVLYELHLMCSAIIRLSNVINSAIVDTEALIPFLSIGDGKVHRHILEVYDYQALKDFEIELLTDKKEMNYIAYQMRDYICHKDKFASFDSLTDHISVEDILDAFDITLSEIIRCKQHEKASTEKKVLGVDILTKLQQMLLTDEDIDAFAVKIVDQSGVYLRLNRDQMQLHVRNNEGYLSPTNPGSINRKAILVSIPKPLTESELIFASKLERAFKGAFQRGNSQTSIGFFTESPRKDELSIITIGYCFPMRCVDWLGEYKQKYEHFLNTGDPERDARNTLLLHGGVDVSQLPSLFVVEKS